MVMGDMKNNNVLDDDKWGGIRRTKRSLRYFNYIRPNQLVDLGFEGVPWTWCNRRENGC